jgi:hypothetical protein
MEFYLSKYEKKHDHVYLFKYIFSKFNLNMYTNF